MDRFLPLPEVERITSLQKSKLYEMIRVGEFPAQKEVTARRRAWLASEVQAWITERALHSSGSQAVVAGGQS
jgi:prophage regulatory protein